MTITLTETTIQSGTELFIPLNKLKPSPRNARKTSHSAAHIEALAASIAVKGILQNLVVEPEMDEAGKTTGFYFVTIGEGRRQAQLLRAKRKEIKKAEPVRCALDTEHDAHEISLDENVTREAMHPADQFEAFQRLAEEKGWGAEEIGARFGVSAHTVKHRGAFGPWAGRSGDPRGSRRFRRLHGGWSDSAGTRCQEPERRRDGGFVAVCPGPYRPSCPHESTKYRKH